MNIKRALSWSLSMSVVFAPASHAATQKRAEVHSVGTTSLSEAKNRALAAVLAGEDTMQTQQSLKPMPKPLATVHGMRAEVSPLMAQGLAFAGFPIVAPDSSFVGFDALDSTDSAVVNHFVVEPPDQGLATNGTQVLETVNLAIQLFSNTGAPLIAPVSLNSFFNVPTALNSDGSANQLSDPRAFYDWESGHWFVSVLTYKTLKGALTGGSAILIAVSSGPDALTSTYTVSSVNVSDASFGLCPCLGDQPLLGLNQDGVYLNTNEYSDSTGRFQTSLITAINKRDLIDGAATITAAAFDGLTVAQGMGFSIQPAFPSPGSSTSQNLGTEFFTSSLDFNGTVDNRIAVWALTNTTSLNDKVPNLNLQLTVINTQEYGQPVPAVQRAGAYPQGQALGDAEERIDTGDDRMMQLFYSKGMLYCAVNTVLLQPAGTSGPRAGAAWFAIKPNASYASLSAKVTSQGLIGIANGSVMYPAFAVNSAGDGVIAFSMTGANLFPSTGYVNFHNGSVTPQVHLAGIGQAADDGFTGYPQYTGGDVARWGDYSAAMVSPNGDLWMASEYIPNRFDRPRTRYTNWGTYISKVK